MLIKNKSIFYYFVFLLIILIFIFSSKDIKNGSDLTKYLIWQSNLDFRNIIDFFPYIFSNRFDGPFFFVSVIIYKIIYNLVRNFVAYSSISSFSEGCSWYLEFEDDSNLTVSIPLNYSGSNSCEYSESVRAYDVNDAIQSAVYNLLELLDFYNDGKLDVKFTEQDFAISSSQIIGIPYGWSSEIQIRRWY